MTLRLRLTIVAAVVVAVVVTAASLTTYFVMRHELYAQVDADLRTHIQSQIANPHPERPSFGNYGDDYVSFFTPNGELQFGLQEMPVSDAIKDAIAGRSQRIVYSSSIVQDHHVRQAIAPAVVGGAVVVVRITDDISHDLGRLRLILFLVSVGAAATAALLAALVSRTTLAPVLRLTAAAERIARTGDPSERVSAEGGDEIARLGGAFNTMLGALEESLETQRRFVADASHELRTPLTSMQTNIEVLRLHERLAPEQRAKLFDDLEREAHEMRDLITGLLELARGDANLERRPVQLDEVVESAVERARTRYPQVSWSESVEPTVVDGVQERLERAVWNLLENAGKWNTNGKPVEVRLLRSGELTVRDHGPGIEAGDRERIFDRFYRAPSARSQPGSGLGLAIVREVAEAHGGTVGAEDAPGGGALMRLRLPTAKS